MPNIEWDAPHTLQTPYATIDLNTLTGLRWIIQDEGYEIIPSVRVTADNISQADGSVLHPHWKTGLVASMKVAYDKSADVHTSDDTANADGVPACGEDLRFMHETLVGALNSILQRTGLPQRLLWQPSGYGDMRMLDQIQVLQWPTPEYALNGTEALVTFSVETPFPYAIDATQTTTRIGSGSSGGDEPLTNSGNCAFSPVVKVYGPSVGFTLVNNTDIAEDGFPREVVYDGNRPGAVHIGPAQYAEIDFFQGKIILNGDVLDLVAGLDPDTTDFWRLLPGSNDVQIVGAYCDVLYNNAWA